MFPIELPILVFDKGADLTIFTSVENAEDYLEAIDVLDDEYTAFDSAGHQLKLEVYEEKRSILLGLLSTNIELVNVLPTEVEPDHEGELRSMLVKYLKICGVSEEFPDDVAIGTLIQKSMVNADTH